MRIFQYSNTHWRPYDAACVIAHYSSTTAMLLETACMHVNSIVILFDEILTVVCDTRTLLWPLLLGEAVSRGMHPSPRERTHRCAESGDQI